MHDTKNVSFFTAIAVIIKLIMYTGITQQKEVHKIRKQRKQNQFLENIK